MSDALTRPERATEINLARRQRSKIMRDPCAYCMHREIAFDRSFCPTLGRIWPRCMNTPGLQFELDESTLRGDIA